MSGADGHVYRLAGNQRAAANPRDNVWLSASAGTGKTQVLSARVLRLLLRRDVDPSQILCLTFTKAGAAEMANRINAVLARWVRLEATLLAKELGDLGADIDPATQARARSLFASVLDCPGGGLRIDTIHAFAQYLLANFPGEAGVVPGTRPMEDRERELLAREVLSELLEQAEASGAHATIAAVESFVRAKSPDALRQWLMLCLSHAGLWEGAGAWQVPVRPRISANLGIPADADLDWADDPLHPDLFPDGDVLAMIPALEAWGTKTAQKCLDFAREWLALDHHARRTRLDGFRGTFLKSDGTPSLNLKAPREQDPHFAERQERIAEALAMVSERRTLVELVDMLSGALELGRDFVLRWQQAKQREGLLEFDDLITRAANLLASSESADWIRYKLDRQFNHILIDEAQDTNAEQWAIVFALIDDFFSGDSAAGDTLRTIFTVGDYKQAIFGFQGTSPENFAKARTKVHQQIEAAQSGAIEMREQRIIPQWRDLDLGQSFRTADTILEFVNRAIERIGAEAFGLDRTPEPHEGTKRPGMVTLWDPVRRTGLEDAGAERDSTGVDQPDWLPSHERVLADRIADQVAAWHFGSDPFVLAKNAPARQARAGDVMVLVRKRGSLAALIVARLHAKGVPVAGVDRLRLAAPLAVQDLMAAVRFAAQPLDDLNLANLLASPLLGWSQEDLLKFVPRAKNVRLWEHLRGLSDARVAETVTALREILRKADFDTPQELLSWILVGPWGGRRLLVSRLGHEANDPIDELINSAIAFEANNTPSLAGFIEWIDASAAELKREAGTSEGQVQVLTVHGSKGLQRPIVILADATGKPGAGGATAIEDIDSEGPQTRAIPLPPLSRDQRAGRLAEAEEAKTLADMQEHWRLLYVAMTRAEEGLFIAGSLSDQQAKSGPPEDSWYAKLAELFAADAIADDIWGGRREWGYRAGSAAERAATPPPRSPSSLPHWAASTLAAEPRPPRPLAPSSAGDDQAIDAPLPPGSSRSSARRGILIHRLLERMPLVDPKARSDLAKSWLARQASDLGAEDREEIVASALGVVDDPAFAGVFAAGMAEVPLAAVVDGRVVAGTVDRLLVEQHCVTVIDFKTSRRPPTSKSQVPVATLRQMAAYHCALEAIYPGRSVRVGVLYTHGPRLIELTEDDLRPHKHRLSGTQQSYPVTDIE